jgi:hypothetical protein
VQYFSNCHSASAETPAESSLGDFVQGAPNFPRRGQQHELGEMDSSRRCDCDNKVQIPIHKSPGDGWPEEVVTAVVRGECGLPGPGNQRSQSARAHFARHVGQLARTISTRFERRTCTLHVETCWPRDLLRVGNVVRNLAGKSFLIFSRFLGVPEHHTSWHEAKSRHRLL